MMAMHETINRAVGLSSAGTNLRAMATGTNSRSQSRLGFSQERRPDGAPWGVGAVGCCDSAGAVGDVMESIYHTSGERLNRRRGKLEE
jgi:hypothetical protein